VKGVFVTFEGPDGSGKTTQIRLLADALNKQGFQVLQTREPGGTPISDQIRSLILSPEHQEMKDQTEVLLYAASRAQHVHEVILPALKQGKIVLCDRFIDASLAYQAYGLGIELESVIEVNRFASSGLLPNRTYLLDVPVEISQSRLNRREEGLDRIEQKGRDYHQRVREGFHQIYKENPERICLIEAEGNVEDIALRIQTDFFSWLKGKIGKMLLDGSHFS